MNTGFWNEIKIRYWQYRRHGQEMTVVTNVSQNIRSTHKNRVEPSRIWRTWQYICVLGLC